MDVHTVQESNHVPARNVEVFDVTGAGDTTAAALAVGLGLGWPLLDCARLANVAAGIVVAKTGTSVVSAAELRRDLADATPAGTLTLEDLVQQVADAKDRGERVVFTNGCFDLLHAGHVQYLNEAASLGDRLVVAINDDAGVTRLKGPDRPVVNLHNRAQVLAGLGCVDWVIDFAQETPEALLAALRPDVLVKGGDYQLDEVVGAELVQGYGGEVRVLSLVQDMSTTHIVDRIRDGSP